MPQDQNPAPDSEQDQEQSQKQEAALPKFKPGELAPFWYSPFPDVLPQLTDAAKAELKSLARKIGEKDIAARRWEVEQSWEARLFDRGYQYLLPRRGGGWILPPFATDYNRGNRRKAYGYETNIYETYGEIIRAALTRDIPEVRFEPKNPEDDSSVTGAEAATDYARCFAKTNDLLSFQTQMAYYLCTDGRAIVVCDHVLDAQAFGREEPIEPVNPETETAQDTALLYLVRHGETELNKDEKMRGASDVLPNNQGDDQMAQAGNWLKERGVSRLVSSPLPRALASSDAISKATGAPAEVDDRFASRDIAGLEGTPADDVAPIFQESEDNPDAPLEGGGESQNELDGRVKDGLFSLLQTPTPSAVVTHDSVISSAFRLFHGDNVPPTELVPPGGIAGIFPDQGGGFTIRPVFPTVTPKGVIGEEKGDPKGAEIVEVFGKLEGKVPINAQTAKDCPFVQVSKEYDYAYVRSMFPDHADDIKPSTAGSGENQLDRIARINACLALEASYVTGDSMVRDCTVQRDWIRPGFFFEVEDDETKSELFRFFPDGVHAIFAGEELVLARNENLDDHVTIIHALPGSGMNRLALCSKLLSLQKLVNNWIDLLNAFFIRTIPQRVVDVDLFNVEAITSQPAEPGDYIPVKRTGVYSNPMVPLENGMVIEKTPTHQPTMPDFIKFFLLDLPQLISGALPSLFGAESNQDTWRGASLQRDQALGRLGTPWHYMQMATCSYFKQAVQLAARCRKQSISMPGEPGESVRIELSDLKGDVLAFPAQDSNFPESWNQKQARYDQFIAAASTNPFIAGILAKPVNAKFAVDMAGMKGFKIPEAACWEKQVGEFEVLLKGSPLPNPQKVQLMQQLQELTSPDGIRTRIAATLNAPPQNMQQNTAALVNSVTQQADQLRQQIASLPDMVSSVAVADTDDNATEAAACLDLINGPEGRKYKNGTKQERDGFANLLLHWREHDAKAKASAPSPPTKPLSVSANVKDMPPRAAAAELAKRGLPVSPEEVAATQGAQ